MKKSKFSEEQIAYALREVEGARGVADVCRQMAVSDATFYAWKKKYGHLARGPPDLIADFPAAAAPQRISSRK